MPLLRTSSLQGGFECFRLDLRFFLLPVFRPDQVEPASTLCFGGFQLAFRDRNLGTPAPPAIGGLDSFSDAYRCIRHTLEILSFRAQQRFFGTKLGQALWQA